jgi:hypothetical protein
VQKLLNAAVVKEEDDERDADTRSDATTHEGGT